jgi:aminoglycoside phosphotransferase (APT) family kinase protein
VGHFDWRVENLALGEDRIVGIYDWDSLAIAPESIVVGNAAAQFQTDWSLHEPDPLPTLDEMRAFVHDYETARGAAFTDAEWELLDAANLAICAYGARCQHSDMAVHPEIGGLETTRWCRLLRERGDGGLLH